MTTKAEYGKFHGLKTEQDWTDHFRKNLHSGVGLVSMYSCPLCDEILYDLFKKHHCKQKQSETKIYESPDKGKTIYERNFGDYDSRKLIMKSVKCLSGNTNPKSK